MKKTTTRCQGEEQGYKAIHTMRAMRSACQWGAAAMLALAAGTAGAQVAIGGSVSGQLAPGVYGRVDIGNAPVPSLIYQQPMIIAPPAIAVPAAPVYMYVPPGHAKHWGKFCGRYNACGQQVYFLRDRPRYYGAPPPPPPHWHGRDRHHDHWERDHRRDRWDRDDRGHRRDRDDHRGHGRHGRD